MAMVTPTTTLCPSARAQEGALVLGVVGPDRTVRMLSKPEPVTTDVAEAVSAMDAPEQQFRFANRCVKSGCHQWTEGRCGVIDLVMSFNRHLAEPIALPACAIRPQCRWHQQNGPVACTVCPFIITDSASSQEDQLEYIELHP